MAKFFIERPIFAWVIAIFIMVLGAVSITRLPVFQYPAVAPPSIQVSVAYPGATAKTLEDTVLTVIEREMNGANGLVSMEAVSQANGSGSLSLSFEPGTDLAMAQVDVQNRLARANPRLPSAVVQQGVRVDQANQATMAFVTLTSTDPSVSLYDLGDFVARSLVPELQRIPGVGLVQQHQGQRAMRIWLEPRKLQAFHISTEEVIAAVRTQNAQVTAGGLGELPAPDGQSMAVTVVVPGQLTSVEAFGNIILRAQASGAALRLKDVARVELAGESYAFTGRMNGQPTVSLAVNLAPDGNAMAVSKALHERMEALGPYYPKGAQWDIPYDNSRFVKISIQQVVTTLLEAIVLVFLVTYLFLQNWRYTLIPTLVVPVALLGTFGALLAFGFSINVLTMFGMVLVIGIVVDDAIVVVENVERIMREEGLSPKEATRKAMGQISGAVIGITVVLISVFIPLAFFSGSIGNIYRQFSVVMVVSITFSAFMALSLSPALCATLLKPIPLGMHEASSGFFGWFNRLFHRTGHAYESRMARLLQRSGRMLVVYLALIGVMALMYQRLPTAFLPEEDQGVVIVNVQLPPGATKERTLAMVQQVEDYVLQQPEVKNIFTMLGFSLFGQGQNAAAAFVTLKDWHERDLSTQSAADFVARANGALMGLRDAFSFVLSPPAIPELGNSAGFSLRLQDRSNQGHDALLVASQQLMGLASQSKVITGVRTEGLDDASQLQVDIDRDRAAALGVGFGAINTAISTALGSVYVNDFPRDGRMQRVILQAEPAARMQPEDVLRLTVLNAAGQSVPLAAFASTRWVKGAMQTVRYNGYPSVRFGGAAAPGYSTGDAMAEVERLVRQLPPGYGIEWSGQSREERLAGAQAYVLYGFAILAVFLCLAALYESWSIPLSVILVVPLGALGVVLGVNVFGLSNDVYFQIALVTIIGLSAKNAILIIEFAKDLQAEGKSVVAAALQAAHLRFRPVVMTSMAFTLGVVPLVLASGPGSASQNAIGVGIIGGTLTGTVLALLFVPVFFVLVRRWAAFKHQDQARDTSLLEQNGERTHE